MNNRHILNLAALAVIVTIIAAIACGFTLERYIDEQNEKSKADAEKEFIAQLKIKAEELQSTPFDTLKARINLPATKTYKETRITFKGIRLEEDCVVVDTDYHGHYGEYTESYSTFIPDSEEEYERQIAFYYLLSTLDDITDKQLRDWAIFNNKPICFKAGGAVDLKGNAIPFISESTAKSLLYDYFGDTHEYRPQDPKREELYAKNDMIAEVYYSYFPEEKGEN